MVWVRLYNPYANVYGRTGGGGGGLPHYDTPTHYDTNHGPPTSLDVSPEMNFEDSKQVQKGTVPYRRYLPTYVFHRRILLSKSHKNTYHKKTSSY